MDYEATKASPPEEPTATLTYVDTRKGQYREVEDVVHVEFTEHHIVFRGRAGVIRHAVLARFVDDLVQQVAA